MMELDGKPVRWWTRSAYAGYAQCVWLVTNEGSMDFTCAGYTYGFVPVLRRKTRPSKTKKIKDLTIWECRAICNANDACGACPLKYVCDFSPKSLGGTILVTEVEVPKK